MARRAVPRATTMTGLAVLALALAACSSWMPPAFSPALSSDGACTGFVGGPAAARAASAPAAFSLSQQVEDVEALRRIYVHTARCLTQDSTLGTAGLLGLSSLALFKGVTSPHPKDMAGLGAVGGFAYLNSSGDAGARQRRDVYYRGADALGCALKAVEPYRLSADDGSRRLDDLAQAALDARNGLLEPERRLRIEAERPAVERVAGKPAADGCQRIARASCVDPGSAGSKPEQLVFEACKTIESRCSAGADTTVTKTTHPAVRLLLADITKARDDIDRLLGDVQVLQGVSDLSARSLQSQSARIQTAVARELDKTFPDPEAVLKSVGNLRAVAYKVTNAPAFGDKTGGEGTPAGTPAGQGHSTGPAKAAVKDLPAAEYTVAHESLRAALDAGTRLRHGLQRVQQRVQAANTDLNSCLLAAAPASDPGTPPPAPPAGPAAGTGAPAPAAPTVIASDIEPQTLRTLLGLPAGAGGDDIKARLQACQQKVLNQPGGSGVTLDAEAMAALFKGQCKGVS